MKTATRIEKMVRALPEGQVVGYVDMGIPKREYPAAAKALSRMVQEGLLKRASTGLFYKPKKTMFGELRPQEEQLLRPYLYQNAKRIAYITGIALYNRMGLTTQVPAVIQVASRSKRIIAKVGSLRIKAVKSYVEVSQENYQLLEILDAIKDFKSIPDRDVKGGLRLLKKKLADLGPGNRKKLVTLALSYPPRTRALAGALLDWLKVSPGLVKPLKNSLNILTFFRMGISVSELPTAGKWNIN